MAKPRRLQTGLIFFFDTDFFLPPGIYNITSVPRLCVPFTINLWPSNSTMSPGCIGYRCFRILRYPFLTLCARYCLRFSPFNSLFRVLRPECSSPPFASRFFGRCKPRRPVIIALCSFDKVRKISYYNQKRCDGVVTEAYLPPPQSRGRWCERDLPPHGKLN